MRLTKAPTKKLRITPKKSNGKLRMGASYSKPVRMGKGVGGMMKKKGVGGRMKKMYGK